MAQAIGKKAAPTEELKLSPNSQPLGNVVSKADKLRPKLDLVSMPAAGITDAPSYTSAVANFACATGIG